MAAGDIVNWVQSNTTGAYKNYQPAAGVEIIITCVDYQDSNTWYLYNGSLEAALRGGATLRWIAGPVRINNSIYIRFYSSANINGAFSGIQVK